MSMVNMKERVAKLAEANQKGVANKAELLNAVPQIVEAQEVVASMRKQIRELGKAVETLADKCGKYVLEHPDFVFDVGLLASPVGVMSGDLTIGGEVYHFASGYGKPVREDGENLTQSFLAGLPKDWTKAKLELDTTAINRRGVDADALLGKGLVRPVKNTWTLKGESPLADDYSD